MQITVEMRGNVRSERCGSRSVLDLVADKWAVIVIYVLAGGTHRFGELQRAVGGVSQKMLTQTLRGLERDGLVERRVYPEVPPRVEYTLSPLGETLVEPLSSLCRWAEEHYWEVERARGRPGADATV
ncbi:MAG TPA: helix-turn-helix domain-containing protein [Longimicrobium sp.]|nr:helix-turn-helix domain-containing protein [Longimicrobium sp.]